MRCSEQFRLFHNLLHDRKEDKYIKMDGSGDEHVAAVLEPNQVRKSINRKLYPGFLALKEMHLSIEFDYK